MANTEGQSMWELANTLFPIYRSITGDGVRQTYDILKEYIGDLSVYEVPTGTPIFDWTVPREWKINDAYIEDENGERIVDFKKNCLHVVGYSLPIDKWVSGDELKEHYLYTQPDNPDAIPYVTSYYKERSGFCVSEKMKQSLSDERYHIVIDSELFDGALTYADILFSGESDREIVFSTYSCHPSMANDNCSGLVLSAELAKHISKMEKRRYTYRFVFIPETIGAIVYLSEKDRYKELQKNFLAGFTFSCVGDDGEYSIVHSQKKDSLSDRVLQNILNNLECSPELVKEYSFLERGSDERQYNSPAIGLNFVGYCRTKYWTFPEYHTSMDDMSFITPVGLQGSYDVMREVVDTIENNYFYRTTIPCEPQLGRRGLYPTVSQRGNARKDSVTAITNFIAYADGNRDLISISDEIKTPIRELIPLIYRLKQEKIIATEDRE